MPSNSDPMFVAKTILQQLGGGRFLAMTGARSLVGMPDGVMFLLPKAAKDNSTKIIIRLMGDDTYQIETFSRVNGQVKMFPCSFAEQVYCEQLRERFTAITGLDTHL